MRTDVYGLYERFGGLRQKRRMEMSRLKSRYAHFRNSAPAESYRFYPSRISEMPEVFPVRLDGDADVHPPLPELAQPGDHTAVPGSLAFSLGKLASQNAVAQRLGSNQPSFIRELE